MIDKSWKLQRYDRKDYSEWVAFPVEIVGRDGVVRRYGFEDAVRLYQRRMTFSPVRLQDDALIRAEQGHCRSRIEQLRKSWFFRYGWPAPVGQSRADDRLGERSGELGAFLSRALHQSGRLDLQVTYLEDDAQGDGIWCVRPPTGEWTVLVAVYSFGPDGVGRDAFLAHVAALEARQVSGPDEERVLAWHQTFDCGFVLTGTADAAASVAALGERDEVGVDEGRTAWDEVIAAIQQNELGLAQVRAHALVQAQPFHRSAYVAGTLAALANQDLPVAEELALLGGKCFPEDARFPYWLAVTRLQAERFAEAEAAARQAIAVDPRSARGRVLLAAILFRAKEPGAASAVLEGVTDRLSLGVLRTGLWWRQVATVGTAAAAAAAVLVAPVSPPLAVVLAATAVASWVTRTRFGDTLAQRALTQRFDDVTTALRALTLRTPSRPAN